jgi:hypothetical protein
MDNFEDDSSDVTGDVENEMIEEEQMNSWVNEGLRNVGEDDDYLRFVSIFGDIFIGGEAGVKGEVSKFGFLSKHLTVTMEAFAIVLYCNNYFKYMKMFWKDNEDMSSVTSSTGMTGTLFTNEGRGSSKYEGWSRAGYMFYNKVYGVVERQRSSYSKEHEFDVMVRKMVQERRGKKRKRESMSFKVRNGLMNLVEI